jgi:hypothetical protein
MFGRPSGRSRDPLAGVDGVHVEKTEEPPTGRQSRHSSEEAGNDRGAKGDRKRDGNRTGTGKGTDGSDEDII